MSEIFVSLTQFKQGKKREKKQELVARLVLKWKSPEEKLTGKRTRSENSEFKCFLEVNREKISNG